MALIEEYAEDLVITSLCVRVVITSMACQIQICIYVYTYT